MIIKKITLKNIRSYKNQIVEFPEGSTLLSGDIGSGKTSVLLGIELLKILKLAKKLRNILRWGG